MRFLPVNLRMKVVEELEKYVLKGRWKILKKSNNKTCAGVNLPSNVT